MRERKKPMIRLRSIHPLLLALSTVLLANFAAGQEPFEPVRHFTLEEYEATLRHWDELHGPVLEIERAGESREGEGIWLVKIADPATPEEERQHSLVTALHGGPERSGTTSVLHLIEWLVGDDPLAAETRRRQETWLVPIINPHAYFHTDRFGNSLKIDPYTGGGAANWDLETLAFRQADRAPEIRAFLEIVDRFRPDAHLDLHGTGLQEYGDDRLGKRRRYQGQIMTEITGSAYSNFALRPWDWRVIERMIAAGEAEGYPSDRFEADAQRLFAGQEAAPLSGRMWRGRPRFYTAQYGYAKYHTLVAANEVAWEESAVARAKGWLAIGNGTWPGERHRGYPVDRVKAFVGHFVTASGKNAAERRESRVRLWQCQESWDHGMLYPQTDGRVLFLVAASAEARAAISDKPEEFLANLRGSEIGASFDIGALQAFLDSGPEIKLAVERGRTVEDTPDGLPDVGIGFRVRLPYADVEAVEVRLNGNPLEGEVSHWEGNGWRQVQVDLPAERAKECRGLFVVTCSYEPTARRRIGWTPPKAVLEELGSGR